MNILKPLLALDEELVEDFEAMEKALGALEDLNEAVEELAINLLVLDEVLPESGPE